MTTPNPNAIDAAIAMIRLDQWGAKGSLVALVRLGTLGDPDVGRRGMVRLPREQVAGFTGLDDRYAYRLLAELVAERVLLRHDGIGSRPHAYAINPDVHRWLNVPWRVDPRTVDLTIAFVCAPPAPATDSPVVARYSAQLGPFAARHSAQQNPLAARSERATTGGLVARYSAQQSSNAGAPVLISRSSKEDPPPAECEEEEEHEPEGLERVLAAVKRTTGRALWGAPRRDVAQAVGELGVERVVRAAQVLAPTVGVSGIVEALRSAPPAAGQGVCAPAPVEPAGPPADPDAVRAALRAAKVGLRGATMDDDQIQGES